MICRHDLSRAYAMKFFHRLGLIQLRCPWSKSAAQRQLVLEFLRHAFWYNGAPFQFFLQYWDGRTRTDGSGCQRLHAMDTQWSVRLRISRTAISRSIAGLQGGSPRCMTRVLGNELFPETNMDARRCSGNMFRLLISRIASDKRFLFWSSRQCGEPKLFAGEKVANR